MATPIDVTYYANLLIVQYKDKPKAYETVKALAKVNVDFVNLCLQVRDFYNLDTAIGVGLDVIGIYVGIKRYNLINATDYVYLNDTDYRILIKYKIIFNSTNNSLKSIVDLIYSYFSNNVIVYSNGLMDLNYTLNTDYFSETIISVLRYNNYLPAPIAVRTVVTAVSFFTLYFSFTSYENDTTPAYGFNDYLTTQEDIFWLTYEG